MVEINKNLKLSDIIDINFLQNFQDVFAKAANVASYTYYDNEKTTKPSNFSDFCINYTRTSKEGLKRCTECDLKWGVKASMEKETTIYKCHAGLVDFAVPIIVSGKHLGTILGGQVLTAPPNLEYYRKLASELELNEDDYIKAIQKVPIVSEENIEAATNLLHIVANAISEIGHKNLELLEKNSNEFLYRNIMETIRSSLDIEETKKRIVDRIGKTLNADRCLIIEYDKENDNFLIIDNEYLSSPDILGLKGRDPNTSVPNFAKMIREGKPIIIENRIIYKDGIPQFFEQESFVIEKYDIDSAVVYPLFFGQNLFGVIALHYVNKNHPIQTDEIQLLSVIANQIAVAIHQSKLYDALKQTTANQEAMLNNIPFMAWLKDEKSRLMAANEIYAKNCKKTVHEIKGKTDFDLFPEDEAKEYVKQDLIAMKSKKPISLEEVITVESGKRIHETFKSPIFDKKGNVIGTVGLARDITEKKEIENELLKRNELIIKAAQREKLLREMVSEISSTLDSNQIRKILVTKLGCALNSDIDIMYVRDPKTDEFEPVDEYSIHTSEKVKKNLIGINVIKDYEWDEAIRQNKKSDIIYSNINELIEDYKLEGKSVKFLEENNIKSMIAIPIIHAGTFLGLLVMNFIGERREFSEDEINLVKIVANQSAIALHQAMLYTQAQEASKAKSEFIATISHEIKTPLNIIIGFSELLTQPNISLEKQQKYIENINKSGKHLLALTKDIINISKIESGIFEANYVKIDSKKLISDVVGSTKLMAEEKNINIDLDLTDIEILADKKMIVQILFNLLSNAIKFTPEGGKILVKSYTENNNFILAVEDNGIGIAPENQKIIFEKFKQIDSSVERLQEGAGLGLAITKELVKMHNGEIFVESNIGSGSIFWINIPLNNQKND